MHLQIDRDTLFVWRNRHLRRIYAKLQIATRQIERLERFNVCIELGAGVTVALCVPAQPSTGILVKQVRQRGFLEILIARDMDFFDLGRLTLGDGEGQVHPIALDGRHRGHHVGGVHALVDVLALEFLLRTVGQRFVVGSPFGQSNIAHGLFHGLFIELFGTQKIHIGNGGALFHHHNQHITVSL